MTDKHKGPEKYPHHVPKHDEPKPLKETAKVDQKNPPDDAKNEAKIGNALQSERPNKDKPYHPNEPSPGPQDDPVYASKLK